MLINVIRSLTLDMIGGAIRHPNADTRRMLAELFWDYKMLLKFDIFKFIETPWPPRPLPDSVPFSRQDLHEEILIGMVDILDGDPDPEPNISGVLRNPGIRLAAAKNLKLRLNHALPLLEKEIAKLEKQLLQR